MAASAIPGFSFVRLRAQFVKEVLSILRDPRARSAIFIPPLLQLLVFAFAATLEVDHVVLAVHNQDTGRAAQELVQQVAAASFVDELRLVASLDEMGARVARGEALAGLAIGADFSRRLAAGEKASVQLVVDGRRSNAGQIAAGHLAVIAAGLGASLEGGTAAPAPAALRHWFNPNLEAVWFIVPGLIGILVLFNALMITALSIARERELGTFDQLLVSPASTAEILISKSLPALVIGLALALVMVGFGVFAFGIPFTGSLALLVVSILVFTLAVVGVGLMISAVSMTQQQAILGAFVVGVPAVLMSGVATPLENMPVFLQWLAQAIPLTHFLVIVEGSFMKAMPPAVIAMKLWPLAAIAVVSLTLATLFVRGRLQ